MNIDRLRQPALAALAAILIGGAGIAFAANQAAPAAPTTDLSAGAPAAEPAADLVEPADPAGQDGDNVQQGDQTTPDSAADLVVKPAAESAADPAAEQEGAETEQAGTETEQAGTETEQAGVEEPGDASLPGGGHADDPNDPNADHQFEGVE
jgi:hypothetical protein